jgi:hypothetical protein
MPLGDISSQINSPHATLRQKQKSHIERVRLDQKENSPSTIQRKTREKDIKQRSVTTLPLMVRFMEILQKGIEIQKRQQKRKVIQQRVLWLGKGCTTIFCGKTKNCARPKAFLLASVDKVVPHPTDINWLTIYHKQQELEIAVLTLRTRDWLVNVLSKLIQHAQAPASEEGEDVTATIEESFRTKARKHSIMMDLIDGKKLGFILEPICPDLSEAKQTNNIFSGSSTDRNSEVNQPNQKRMVELVQINGAEPGSIGHALLESGEICISDILYSIGGITVLGQPIEAIFEVFKKERSFVRKAARKNPELKQQMELVLMRARKQGLPGTPVQKGSI